MHESQCGMKKNKGYKPKIKPNHRDTKRAVARLRAEVWKLTRENITLRERLHMIRASMLTPFQGGILLTADEAANYAEITKDMLLRNAASGRLTIHRGYRRQACFSLEELRDKKEILTR